MLEEWNNENLQLLHEIPNLELYREIRSYRGKQRNVGRMNKQINENLQLINRLLHETRISNFIGK